MFGKYFLEHVVYSEKGKKLYIINEYKFCFHKFLANEEQRWVCTNKTCRAYMRIDSSGNIIDGALVNNHAHTPDSEERLARQRISNDGAHGVSRVRRAGVTGDECFET